MGALRRRSPPSEGNVGGDQNVPGKHNHSVATYIELSGCPLTLRLPNSPETTAKNERVSMAREQTIDHQRAALADKLAALKIPSDLVDLVRSADAGLGKINAEAAELQAKIDGIDSQLGLRELDRRTTAEKVHQEKLTDRRANLVGEANQYLEAISAAEAAARTLAASVQRAFESNARIAGSPGTWRPTASRRGRSTQWNLRSNWRCALRRCSARFPATRIASAISSGLVQRVHSIRRQRRGRKQRGSASPRTFFSHSLRKETE